MQESSGRVLRGFVSVGPLLGIFFDARYPGQILHVFLCPFQLYCKLLFLFIGSCWTMCHDVFPSCIQADADTAAQEVFVGICITTSFTEHYRYCWHKLAHCTILPHVKTLDLGFNSSGCVQICNVEFRNFLH